MNLDYKMFKN